MSDIETKEFQRIARHDLVDGFLRWDLWWRLSWLEIKRRYRRTLLGPLWVTVSLGIFAMGLSAVWSVLWKMKVSDYLPYLLSGMIPWVLIASCLGESCVALLTGEATIRSRQFSYTMLVNVAVARNTVIFGHNMLAYLIAAILCGVPFTVYTLLALPGLALILINLSWLSLVIAILGLRFRDVQQLITLVLQLAMLITPIFWPVSQLGSGRATLIVDFNLLYHMIDVVRSPLLGKPPALESYFVCIIFGIVGWFFAYWLLAKKRHRLAYWF